MALYGHVLALALRRQREADEEEAVVKCDNETSSSAEHHKADMDTGHLVLYIVLGVFGFLFAPVLLVVFWAEMRLKCRRLATGKRGREKKKKTKKETSSKMARHPLAVPLETIQEEERGGAQPLSTNNNSTAAAAAAGFPSQSHGGGNAEQGQVPQEQRSRAHSI
ncbi:uncharacterized protein PG998_008687 [Apiospora kogelbergensis]|uniref:uncharacterized protein n=1 Tax=Apiospora kogelbergensis TaxID=1337665 RepID=UPI00312F37FF